MLPAISALAVSGNASAQVDLGCNESFDAGKHCSIEVKCYSADITGSGEFSVDGGEVPATYASYYFSNDSGTICAGSIVSTLPKQEYRCTENGAGPDSSGDLAVKVEIDLTGCAD